MNKYLFQITLISLLLALVVVVLGAYVRLSDAGLGCPDWPGCYGKLTVPQASEEIAKANEIYPERPVHQGRAWKEMIHRYAAGILGLLILYLTIAAWKHKQQVVLSTLLLGLVIFQAALGMWTVTLLLKPIIVTAHLIGGMTVLSLLYWLLLRQVSPVDVNIKNITGILKLTIFALVILTIQIFLGGWTSANYAALVCTEFPTCRAGDWFPPLDFAEGFTLWRGLGIDYEGGVLDAPGRTAIHISHRMGAVVALLIIGYLTYRTVTSNDAAVQRTGLAIGFMLLVQVMLGVANILLVLPLPVAAAHNAVAALLLLSIITLLHHVLPASVKTESE